MNDTACPKCSAVSGDDWTQCRGSCPLPGTPHFDERAAVDVVQQRARQDGVLFDQSNVGNDVLRDEQADQGIGISRGFSISDYEFSREALSRGWQRYITSRDHDQFGVWVNEEKRLVFTYCEGDRSLVVCGDQEAFRSELEVMAQFYGTADNEGARWTCTERS